MTRLLKTFLFWTLLLGACSPGISSPQIFPASDTPTLTPLPHSTVIIPTELPLDFQTTTSSYPKLIATLATPHIDPGPDGQFPTTTDLTPEVPPSITDCGYQWAYKDLPELTAYFDQAIKNIIPNSSSHTTAFGENCISNEGQILRFLPMETDFYVTASVVTLDDYETFGIWLAQVMQIVNAISPDMIAGPKPGFVEFRFEKNPTESIGFRVPIQQYNEIVEDVTGEELLRMFYTTP